MSHVAVVDLEIKDLPGLKAAAEALGLEFVEGQGTYRWYGKWVNDYHGGDAAYKNGISPEDYGKCDHALRIPGKPGAYEVGVVKRKDGNGYTLIWDFFAGGYGLRDAIGNDGHKLKQEYAATVATRKAKAKGFTVTRTWDTKGNLVLKARRLAK